MMLLPRLSKTGEFAQVNVTTRESSRRKAQVNVRFSLPRRSMFVAADGRVEQLPRSADSSGLSITQFAISLN
jgi:hypothetical protein